MTSDKTLLKLARTFAIALLSFNAIGAIYGGSSLVLYPDGSDLHLDLAFLEHTPFLNYFIPGLILLLFNGVLSLFVVVATAMKCQYYPIYIIGQGLILFGWIIIQMLLIRTINVLHFIMGSVGIALIVCGAVIVHRKNAYSQ